MNRFRLITLGISVTFFLISMQLPALGYEKVFWGAEPVGLFNPPTGDLEIWFGWQILCLGLLGILFVPHLSFGWLANLFYFASIICLLNHRFRAATILALLAIIIGISGTLWTVEHGLPADEGGVNWFYLNDLYAGFWFWVASQATILCALIARSIVANQQ